MKIRLLSLLSLLLVLFLSLVGCDLLPFPEDTTLPPSPATGLSPTPEGIPAYSGSPYYVISAEGPSFTPSELLAAAESYEYFSPLDSLGRCGVVHASVGIDLMPTEDRESIGSVKPSGWQTAKYDIVSGKYLYNRCHLIGFQLTGENANERNLITGTRYMNVDGMLPFEDMVADYVKDTENHVLYRVSPYYNGNDLVAGGVRMEAFSVEDNGEGIAFDVFVYNVQPGISISYADGTSFLSSEPPITAATTTTATPPAVTEPTLTYIVNTSTKKFHKPECHYANSMAEENRDTYSCTRGHLIGLGFSACGSCHP